MTNHDPVRQVKQETLALLAGIVPVTGAVFYSVDPDLNAVDHELFRLTPDLLPAYVDHFHRLDPMHPRRLAPLARDVVTLSETVRRGDLVRSTYYRDFMRPLGADHEAELCLRHQGRMTGGISLLRAPAMRPFAARETAMLRAVHPLVELALALAGGAPAPRHPDGLTRREAEVVDLVCAGESNAGIARALGIALPTVKTHLEHVFAKLGVRSRGRLVAHLMRSATLSRCGFRRSGPVRAGETFRE